MKMPRRPFYPPMELPPDIFGLQRPTLLNFESDEETRKRVQLLNRASLPRLGRPSITWGKTRPGAYFDTLFDGRSAALERISRLTAIPACLENTTRPADEEKR
jgi:hypothetical protein